MVLEEDGKDYQRWDWGVAHQLGRPVSGEGYVFCGCDEFKTNQMLIANITVLYSGNFG